MIALCLLGGIIEILVGYLLGALVSFSTKSRNAKNVGVLYIYRDSVDNADHIYADFHVDIDEIKKMKDCRFTVDTSLLV